MSLVGEQSSCLQEHLPCPNPADQAEQPCVGLRSSPESSHFLQYLSWFGVPAFPAGAQLLVCVGGSLAFTSPATNALIGFLDLFFLLKIFKVPFFPHPFNPTLPLPALLTGERVAQAVLEDSIP